MRYLSTRPPKTIGNLALILALLIVVVLSAWLYFQWTTFSASAESAPLPLMGEAAAAQPIDPPLAQLPTLRAHDGSANDNFGASVASSGDQVVVGASHDDIGAVNQGSAYVFIRAAGPSLLPIKLTAGDGEANDNFGASISISGDTVVIGAPLDNIGTNADQGSAYVFVRMFGAWSLQQKLTAGDGAANDNFGRAVALNGDTVIIGANEDDGGKGSAYVFVRAGTAWTEQRKLTASDGAANDNFGRSVAFAGDTALVGANEDDGGKGSAYVFVRAGTAWTEQQKLVAGDGEANDLFGFSIALSGETAVIGAYLDDNGANTNQGSAYVFVRAGTAWTEQSKLTAADGALGDQFGFSVALDGNTALVGAYADQVGTNGSQGSAYTFSRSGTTWTQKQHLTTLDGRSNDQFGWAVSLHSGAAYIGALNAKVGENFGQGTAYVYGCGYIEQQPLSLSLTTDSRQFGYSVAVSDNTAVIGAPRNSSNLADRGSAYVFVRNGEAWTQQAQLIANDGAAGDHFGESVAISGDTIVIGAPEKTIGANSGQGAIYVFVRSGVFWTQQARLTASDGSPTMQFGKALAINAVSLIAVGAPGALSGRGAVYTYTRSGSLWTEKRKLTASDIASEDLGWSVALAGGAIVLAGAPDSDGSGPGAVYAFNLSATTPANEQRKLTPSDGVAGDQFGRSLAADGNLTLIGAPHAQTGSSHGRGATYVFVLSGTQIPRWAQQARLSLSDGGQNDQFGWAVALNGNTAVVGAYSIGPPVLARRGATYVFARNGAVWTLQQELFTTTSPPGSLFGESIIAKGDTLVIGSPLLGGGRGAAYVLKTSCGKALTQFTSVSAASFAVSSGLAPESIVAGFGADLTTGTQAASDRPLPTELSGVSVIVRDGGGGERLAPLFFVSPGQINYQIPPGTANGPGTVTVTGGAGPIATGAMAIATVAPGLFTANSSGQGVPAAFALRVKPGGAQSIEPVAQFDVTQNRFVPTPIDLGPATDQVFLVLYGTGLRFRSSLSAVSCAIGAVSNEVLFAGAVPEFIGLDQVNVRLSRSLAGRGEVDVVTSVDGKTANTVRASIK